MDGLPGDTGTTIISLLGRKHGPAGVSEFSFYSFCGGFDVESERAGKPTFQEWLDKWHQERSFSVIEHPTFDLKPVSQETLAAIASDIERELAQNRTIILVDSGGETRTRLVCTYLDLVEDSRATC
jgi:hypothetical protein